MKIFKYLFLCLLFTGCAHTADVRVPKGCDVLNVSDHTITLYCDDQIQVIAYSTPDLQ